MCCIGLAFHPSCFSPGGLFCLCWSICNHPNKYERSRKVLSLSSLAMSYRPVVSSTGPLAVNQMEHKYTNERNFEHYLYIISGKADPVQWFDMLTECFSRFCWKAIYLTLLMICVLLTLCSTALHHARSHIVFTLPSQIKLRRGLWI